MRFVALLLLFCTCQLQAQHTLQLLVTAPANTPATDTLFVAGSFNAWNPHHLPHALTKTSSGQYSIRLQLPAGAYECKITRGAWATVQTTSVGTGVDNIRVSVPDTDTLLVMVAGWADAFAKAPPRSTASKNVKLVRDSFYMPQLSRHRKIWI